MNELERIKTYCASRQDCLTKEGFCPFRNHSGCIFRNSRPDHWDAESLKNAIDTESPTNRWESFTDDELEALYFEDINRSVKLEMDSEMREELQRRGFMA